MFHFDRGLKLTRADLAIDMRRRQPRGFISHAHADHMARHELALCTPGTARLYQLRMGKRAVLELEFRQPMEWGGLRLTTYPAGHCLGSAMLLAEDDACSLLYTGDFKLTPSATAEPAELPRADILVIESTFGQPRYRMPPREDVIGQLVALVRQALERGCTPVVEAYALGKSQEVTRILTDAGYLVVQTREVYEISLAYEALGVSLGKFRLLEEPLPYDAVVVAQPRAHRQASRRSARPLVTFAVTGWAIDAATKYRLGVDHALPLSDHADYDELFETVERVQPREIYVTHGPEGFADRLCERGFNARPLASNRQGRLF